MEANGFILLKNVLTPQEIKRYRAEVNEFIRCKHTIKNAGGIMVPDFIKHKSFFKTLRLVKDNPRITRALETIFNGQNYRFCSQNDVSVNRILGWHKDILGSNYAKYQSTNIWSETENKEKYEIYKVAIYLQDHSDNDEGLTVIPGSHKDKNITLDNPVRIRSNLGDIIIFDQRLTHAGAERINNSEGRILVCFGFGSNNIFTDEFEKGTKVRQNTQNRSYFVEWWPAPPKDINAKIKYWFNFDKVFTVGPTANNIPQDIEFLIVKKNFDKNLLGNVIVGGIIMIPIIPLKNLQNIHNIRCFALLKDCILLQKITPGIGGYANI